jgi:TolA-binding protein
VALVDRIHFGHNPFGPDERFVSDFQGLIRLTEPTTLRLFSTHSQAAFVLINGQLLLGGTEPNITRRYEDQAAQAREISLPAGVHHLRYLHATQSGEPRMALGVVEERRAIPLPARLLVQHEMARLGPARAGGDQAVGFDAEQLDQMGHEEYLFTRVALRPIAPPPAGQRYRFDFGDSTSVIRSDAERFEHVFPGPAEGWRVTMELIDERGRATGSAAANVRPVVFAHSQTIGNERLLERYAAAMAGVDYSRATQPVLAALCTLASATEQPALIAPVAEPFVERFAARGELAWEMKHVVATTAAASDPQRAVKLFGELAQAAPDSWRATTAAAEMIDLMVFRLNQTGNVQAAVAPFFRGRTPREQALLRSKVADAHRAAGRYDRAREAYQEAQQATYRAMEGRQAAVVERGYRETALSLLQQNRLPAMRDVLLQWEADFPAAKLGSDLPLLTGRYYEAVGDDARAAIEYRTLLELSPLHPSRPEIAYRLGDSLWRMGKHDEATPWLTEVVETYPNSPFAQQAANRLR